MNKNEEPFDESKFDWIQLHKDMGTANKDETQKDKLIRKVKENPFVPIGVLLTTAALSAGLWSFRTGRRQMSQYMMRSRVVAQGFTIFALVVGMGMGWHGTT